MPTDANCRDAGAMAAAVAGACGTLAEVAATCGCARPPGGTADADAEAEADEKADDEAEGCATGKATDERARGSGWRRDDGAACACACAAFVAVIADAGTGRADDDEGAERTGTGTGCGSRARILTEPACACRSTSSWPVYEFHTRICPLAAPDTRCTRSTASNEVMGRS